MPSRTTFLLPAVYKNISFFVRSESIDQIGQKNIIHDYPNTSNRYVERQGKKPFLSTIEIFFSGVLWKQQYKNFVSALENPSPGRLILPTFGVINNVVATIGSSSASQEEVGEISLSVTFTETTDRPSPTQSDTTTEDVYSSGGDARAILMSIFATGYDAPTTLNNKLSAKSDLITLSNFISNITGLGFETKSFNRDVPKYLSSPTSLASLLLSQVDPLGLLTAVGQIESEKSFDVFKKLSTCGNNLPNAMNDIRDGKPPVPFMFPDAAVYSANSIDTNINVWDLDTTERIQRTQNRYVVINCFRVAGLISMLESASNRTYFTTIEVNKVSSIINEYYIELIEDDTTGVLISEIKPHLDSLKIMTEEVLSQKRQQAFNVKTIEIERPYSSKLLTYDLYGEYIKTEEQLNQLASIIRGLNKSLPAHAMEGTVNILELR